MRRAGRAALAAVLGLACLLAVSCLTFEPVRESLTISIDDAGSTLVHVIAIEVPSKDEDVDAAVARRLERLRSEIEAGRDPWAHVLAPDRLPRVREEVEWADGLLAERRIAAAAPIEELPGLLSEGGLSAWTERGEGWLELTLQPPPPARASQAQRDLVARTIDDLADAHFALLTTTAAALSLAETDPAAARERLAALGSLEREESAPVAGVLRCFIAEEGDDGWSLDELARHVLDPYPSTVHVEVAGAVIETEGFVRTEAAGASGSRWTVPPTSLAAALGELEDRWVSPDPAALLLRSLREDRDLDFTTLLEGPRRIAPPADAEEVRQALREALVPVTPCRIRWTTSSVQQPGG